MCVNHSWALSGWAWTQKENGKTVHQKKHRENNIEYVTAGLIDSDWNGNAVYAINSALPYATERSKAQWAPSSLVHRWAGSCAPLLNLVFTKLHSCNMLQQAHIHSASNHSLFSILLVNNDSWWWWWIMSDHWTPTDIRVYSQAWLEVCVPHKYKWENAHRPRVWCESAVGEIGAAEVPKIWDHEERISHIWGGMKETSILPSSENWETDITFQPHRPVITSYSLDIIMTETI